MQQIVPSHFIRQAFSTMLIWFSWYFQDLVCVIFQFSFSLLDTFQT